jgi:dienelactone hydrolase
LAKGSNCAALGYAEYVPVAYATQGGWPLIIALNGDGQAGTGSAIDIQKIDDDGLPKQIAASAWDPNKRFVVLAPQMNWETRTADQVNNFIQFAKANYKVDPKRIYLTALSGGGGPFYRYMEAYNGIDVAAAVPIDTLYSFSAAPTPCMWKAVPTWLFFGENDPVAQVFSHATAPYDGLKQCVPAPLVQPKLTVYTSVGHDSWTRTFSLTGMSNSVVAGRDPYNMSVYDWMLQYTKGGAGVIGSSSSSSKASSSKASSSVSSSSLTSSSSSSSKLSSSSSSSSSSFGATKNDPEFGSLTLVDSFDPVSPGARATQMEPVGAFTTPTILGRQALMLTPQNAAGAMQASYAAFVIGKNKGLVAGQAYVLEFDYPDDAPRHMVFLNRGADLVRTVATGKETGDNREQYAYPNPESLAYPHTNLWQTYRFYFTLHDRFQPLAAVRNEVDTKRPFGPADGFWVAVAHYNPIGNPMNEGAVVGQVRLYSVNNTASAALAINYPPGNLPHRRTFWREEMNDSTALCQRGDSVVNTDPSSATYANAGVCNPATGTSPGTTTNTWLEYKMKLANVLGFNVFTKDLLEFGHNQGFNTSNYGGSKWFYSARVAFWPEMVQKASTYGLDVLPYFEYYGAMGEGEFSATSCPSEDATGNNFCSTHLLDTAYQCKKPWGQTQATCFMPSYGSQHNCEPLTRVEKHFTPYTWAETACVDVTDPKALVDVKKLVAANVLDLKDTANFAGVWFRTRVGSWPISFGDATRARYAAERNIVMPTKAELRASSAQRADYYAWWNGKRQAYLTAIRDYLRAGKNGNNGVSNADVLFTSYHEESLPIPAPNYGDTRVVSDDTTAWSIIDSDPRWQYRYSPINALTWLADKRYETTLSAMNLPTEAEFATTNAYDEMAHGTPPADPAHYQAGEGVLMTMPYGRQYTMADPTLLQKFSTQKGMALVRHFPLNEDDGTGNFTADSASGSFKNWPMSGHFGYFVSDVERSTPYTMLAEVKGVANADPYWIGYLSSNSFNTGAPQDLRRFNAAYLAWPAQPSLTVAAASSTSGVIVRDMVTSAGKFVAVFNTDMTAKSGVQIIISATRMGAVSSVQDRVTLKNIAVLGGKLTLDLQVADFKVFYVP